MTTASPKNKTALLLALTCLMVSLIGGIVAVNALARHERQRDLGTWELTLNIMADSRALQIQQWINGQFTALNELAANGSLQIYSQQLQQNRTMEGKIEPAQLSYLNNLILNTAQRYNFVTTTSLTQTIPANVSCLADAGLALVAKDITVISATPGMPPLDTELQQAIRAVIEKGAPTIQDIALDNQDRPVINFLVPVFAALPQTDANQRRTPIAVLVGKNNADKTLFPLLTTDTAPTITDEAFLVRRDNNLVVYLSPLADGSPPLNKKQPVSEDRLAAAWAVRNPGAFTQGLNYAGTETLSTSRALPGLPWTLIQTINADEALRESTNHQRFLSLSLLLGLSLAAALLVAAWVHGGKVKCQQETAQLQAQAQQLTAQSHLLSAINDNIRDYLFLVRINGSIIFINQASASALNIMIGEASGKTLQSTLGKFPADQLMVLVESAVNRNQLILTEISIELNGRQMQCHTSAIAFPYMGAANDVVLISLHDVSQINEAREKKERLLTQTVQALMRAIDLHDPYSANHSAKTTTIAIAIGKRLGLPQPTLQVIEFAASLCNIGKLFIASELLAKTEALTEQEHLELRKEPEFAEKILGGIEFDGPVLATIAQKNEHLDGSGHPAGLKEESIIITARVLSAANAFVAMTSPRAYRDTLTPQKAMTILLEGADRRYDRRVVAALFQVAENEIDWNTWPPKS